MTKKKNPGDMPDSNNKKTEDPNAPEQELIEDAEVEIIEEDIDAAAESAAEEPAFEKEKLLNSLMSLKADFENYRKRMLKEQTRILETAEADLIRKLLPVVDNLERALAAEDSKEKNTLREGVQMVLDQMLEIFNKEGLEEIDPEGEPFNPEHHEAMMVVETDKCPENQVVEVVQKGYRFRSLLIRPAMVKVSCAVNP